MFQVKIKHMENPKFPVELNLELVMFIVILVHYP